VCRNIKTLFHFDPPVTEEEIRASSLQFVRKVSGFNKPSKINEAAFSAAVEEVAAAEPETETTSDTEAADQPEQTTSQSGEDGLASETEEA